MNIEHAEKLALDQALIEQLQVNIKLRAQLNLLQAKLRELEEVDKEKAA